MNTLIVIIVVIVGYIWPLVVCWKNADTFIKNRVVHIYKLNQPKHTLRHTQINHIYKGWQWELLLGFVPVINIIWAIIGEDIVSIE